MNKKKRRFPWALVVTLLVLVGAGAFFGIRYVQAQSTASSALPANLTTTPVKVGSLSATVGASGNVRSGQTATLTWGTSGKVGQIMVKEGQKVQAGDILAALDVTSLTSSSLISAQADLITAQKALNDLKNTNNSVAIAQAEQAIAKDQKAVSDAQTSRDLLNYNRSTGGNLDAALANLYIAQDALSKAQSRFDTLSSRAAEDPARASAEAALVQAQQTVFAKQQIVNWYQSGPSANDIAQADAALELAKAQLANDQTTLANLKAGVSADDLAVAQAKVDIAKAALNQRYVVAPFSGTITLIKSMVGDQVSAGSQALRIDDTSSQYVDMQISEIDIDRVKVGQNVTMVFDALPSKTYNGTVDRIDSVGTVSSGAVNFTVTVKMSDADASVKSAMTASASVVLEKVDNVMMVPNRGIRTQNNLKYVLVLQSGVINSIPVRVGIANDTQTQVTSNTLKEGDLIVTNPLSDLQKNGQNLFNALIGGGARIPGAGGGFQGGSGGFQGGNGGNRGGGTTIGGTGGGQ